MLRQKDVETKICAITCSDAPEGRSEWTMQAIADGLIRLEVVDYITDSTVCDVMKKMNSYQPYRTVKPQKSPKRENHHLEQQYPAKTFFIETPEL